MKSKKRLLALLTVIATLATAVCFTACGGKTDKPGKFDYIIAVDYDLPFTVEVGDEIDFKQYFVVVKDGSKIDISDDMLDLSAVDTSKEGEFTVTLKAGGASEQITFTVVKKGGGDKPNDDGDDKPNDDDGDKLKTVLAQYGKDDWAQNFAVQVSVVGADLDYTDNYEYLGKNIKWTFAGAQGGSLTDYVGYDALTKTSSYYLENDEGVYETYSETENEDEFWENYLYMDLVDLTALGDFDYEAEGDAFVAKKPNDAGETVLGKYEDSTWTSFKLTIDNGNVATIVAQTNDGYTYEYTFSKFGSVSFTLPDSGGTTTPTKPTEPTGVMDKQTYDADNFDDETLQEKLTTAGDEPDPYIGLPSTGTYSALVIPVKFSDKQISDTELSNLDLAFNDAEGKTGWESVRSYYKKASYGKLDISFDIAGVNLYDNGDKVDYFRSGNSYSYYEQLTATEDGETYNIGDNVLLHEALAYYESRIDLSKYDYNKDGAIDAVYLIYSGEVDYSNDSFYWAYVTWNYEEKQYDGLDAFYYLFAGLGFMKESVQGGYTDEYYPAIPGLKINASTYIHETGHLFGLEDYYDYYPEDGSNEGLGGADMMDATVGDQNVFSKIMLGWLTPEIVTSTKTVAIQSSQAKGDAILIPLDFNNSYFCEYLLIDLYAKDGLNELHGNMENTYLYDGAEYGVRIYHVSSRITDPWNNDFGSFTDNNNSMSDIALIKLVEADGETGFSSTGGYADKSDLWQAGDKLSAAFPQYMTNDGKTLIFDISVDSVSATQATVTVTYAA